MRKLLTAAKFIPLVLSVMWWSGFSPGGTLDDIAGTPDTLILRDANIHICIKREPPRQLPAKWLMYRITRYPTPREMLGRFPNQLDFETAKDLGYWYFTARIPFLLTCLLLLSAGWFSRYRFPLWSWFAWVALIAAELAFYFQ